MNTSPQGDGAEDEFGAVAAPSPEVTHLALHLMAVRSAVVVGVMLNERFPTEEAFMDFLNTEETLEGLQAFSDARDDVIALAVQQGTVTSDAVISAVSQHHPRALEAIDVLAARIGVTPQDLFSFLLRA